MGWFVSNEAASSLYHGSIRVSLGFSVFCYLVAGRKAFMQMWEPGRYFFVRRLSAGFSKTARVLCQEHELSMRILFCAFLIAYGL